MTKSMVLKLAGLALLTIGVSSVALAYPAVGPEIDAATGANALALLTGALLIIRGRKKR
jgi:hypothetical protein